MASFTLTPENPVYASRNQSEDEWLASLPDDVADRVKAIVAQRDALKVFAEETIDDVERACCDINKLGHDIDFEELTHAAGIGKVLGEILKDVEKIVESELPG